MVRKYELRARAEGQERTRRRITEAALELHTEVGPARTTVSDIAARAGVQRHTYYRHFPDGLSLGLACSGLALERDPLPDPGPWAQITDAHERLEHGLGELYAYYEHNQQLLGNVIRDSDADGVGREIMKTQYGPPMAAIQDALSRSIGRRRRHAEALLLLALQFHTWQSLTGPAGMRSRDAARLMAAAIRDAARA